ncbi:MAG TPA: class A beta-lactamase [Burkholderiales bacterium]|jgi:beta-lactamase class A|nr:class A beta-lactamase [Burkholderiales bacterium]
MGAWNKLKLLILISTTTVSLAFAASNSSMPLISESGTTYQTKFAQLESSVNGRLGIMAINTANNQQLEYRGNELFPFCSTGKVMVVGAILKASESNPQLMLRQLHYSKQDTESSGYAPISGQHIKDGMSVSALSQAAIAYSDNGAMNQLLQLLGGPQAVTSYARSMGDDKFNFVRTEPQLNTAIPGDERDTTTPVAMALSLQKLSLGTALDKKQQAQLQEWLKANTTGDKRIRAGVPKGWIVGDKTGTGSYGTTNDVAVIWPPQAKPIVLVVYFTQNKKDAKPNDQVIAQATKIVIDEFTTASKK